MLLQTITRSYEIVRNKRRLNTLVILFRFVIGFAFIPSGLKKILGERFTQLGTDNPVGFFFEGLFRTGFYWNFLGWAQLLAAMLLITQRFATLAAVIFFFIMVNIWVITVSMHFTGTWVITTLMLLATLALLVWDFHKLKFILFPDNFALQQSFTTYPSWNSTWIIAGIIFFCISVVGFLAMNYYPPSSARPALFLLATLSVIVLAAAVLDEKAYRKAI